MTENLQQHLVDLTGIGLGANRVTELALYHGKVSFCVRTPMIMSVERFLVQSEISVQALPRRGALASGVRLEEDVRVGPMRFDAPQVGIREIRFVCGNLSHRETLGGAIQ